MKRVFQRKERLPDERLIDISNVEYSGAVARRDSPKNLSNFANQLWHSDSSFMKPRAAYSNETCSAVSDIVSCRRPSRRKGDRRRSRCPGSSPPKPWGAKAGDLQWRDRVGIAPTSPAHPAVSV